ncbi:hypothetical protein PR048_033243 [Dryococelus australis]|uniref:Uncharacterized protein n=1 Tax=Dryococelus australis TaxID=614101 RepID=A0ABQ9G2V5_9NEOP|nr:hypothetical protein PR048_033243 [Dryococelus australis]
MVSHMLSSKRIAGQALGRPLQAVRGVRQLRLFLETLACLKFLLKWDTLLDVIIGDPHFFEISSHLSEPGPSGFLLLKVGYDAVGQSCQAHPHHMSIKVHSCTITPRDSQRVNSRIFARVTPNRMIPMRRRIFSGISRSPSPFHSGDAPHSPHFTPFGS